MNILSLQDVCFCSRRCGFKSLANQISQSLSPLQTWSVGLCASSVQHRSIVTPEKIWFLIWVEQNVFLNLWTR